MSHEKLGTQSTVTYAMPARPSDRVRSMEFSRFFSKYKGAPFCVRTEDGWAWSSSELRGPALTASFVSRDRLDAVIGDSTEASLGRAFLSGELDVQGDLLALLAMAEYIFRHSGRLGGGWIASLTRARLDISNRVRTVRRRTRLHNWRECAAPCDLPGAFFEHWLGSSFSHIAARTEREACFDEAQRAALQRVCTLLELERGDRLLGVGCGWGALLMHAARHIGVDAWGTTASEEQASTANRHALEKHLAKRCVVEHRDLRVMPLRDASFDKATDIGIFEQVSRRHLRDFLLNMRRMLVPGGLFLTHRLIRASAHASRTPGAMRTDLFAEAEPGSLSHELDIAEACGLQVRSVENITEEYEETVRAWIGNLQREPGSLDARVAPRARRRWLLYLVETATALQTGELEVYQILLRRPVEENDGL